MRQEGVAVGEETPDMLKSRLAQVWGEIDERRHAGEVECDMQRAEALTIYLGLGLTQREMAACTQLSQQRVDQLLRYGRFITLLLTTEVVKIPETQFRRYWQAQVDPQSMYLLRGKTNAVGRREYEQRVFQAIVERLRQGNAPPAPRRTPPKTVEAIPPQRLEQLRRDVQASQVLVHKAIREAYARMEQDVRELIALSGCSRSTYAPNILAMHAKRLKAGFADLQKAVKGDVDQWLLDLLTEPAD